MTVTELFNSALAELPSNRQEDSSLEQYAVMWVNGFAQEAFDVENSIRIRNGKEPLTEVPRVNVMSDTIPFDERLVRYAFKYDMAAKMAKDDDDRYAEQDLRARAIVALNEIQKLEAKPIKDIWG